MSIQVNYCYVTKRHLGNGEYAVQGATASGALLFGFRTFDVLGLKERARSYTPCKYIPVFDRVVAQ